ncbi:MAG TPA: hypothetical protein VG605_14815, partial [Puia sp.]|nr:hypothetical protein [Puia sp.]
MKKNIRYSLLWLPLGLAMSFAAHAQADTSGARRQDSSGLMRQDSSGVRQQDTSGSSVYHLAIFTPLYLDSAFDPTGTYRYDKSFPKFINPGLEFYEGAQMALDTMEKEHVRLDVQIYDTRSDKESLQQMLEDSALQHVDLMIAEVSNTGELQQLAAAAQKRNIPFIDANYPNDGGVTNNPSLVILNSTLKTHCEGIYRYMQRNYPTKSLIFFGKAGSQEDRLKGYFKELDKKTAGVPLNIHYVTLNDNFDASTIAADLDSNTLSVCVAG